jgi:acetyltransferase
MIRPYPTELARSVRLRDGTLVSVRPIRPEDHAIEREFVRNLSADSKYFRFMSALGELPESMLNRFTHIDYDREMALIALVCENGRETEIGVARYVADDTGSGCEFAVAIADAWQHRGLGAILLLDLIAAARRYGFTCMHGIVLATNAGMLGLAHALGFAIRTQTGEALVRYVSKRFDADGPGSQSAASAAANVN